MVIKVNDLINEVITVEDGICDVSIMDMVAINLLLAQILK